MRAIFTVAIVTTAMSAPLYAWDVTERLTDAAAVLSEVMATPDKGIPHDLIQKPHCIVIVPELKTGAFIVGAKYGKGFISCRNASGRGWSAAAGGSAWAVDGAPCSVSAMKRVASMSVLPDVLPRVSIELLLARRHAEVIRLSFVLARRRRLALVHHHSANGIFLHEHL